MHRHGWDCFKTSGGMLNAIEQHIPLSERIEKLYKVAYRTGYKNGTYDALHGSVAVPSVELESELKRE
jgi:hypothetical protein